MRQGLQRAATGGFVLSLSSLIPFWGRSVVTLLYGALIASVAIWLLARFAFRRGGTDAALGVVVGDSWVAAPQSALQAMAVELTITNVGRERASVDVSFEMRLDDGRWSRDRPLAPGAVLDGHPYLGVLAVSGSPVAVEARDSYRAWFGMEIGNPRLKRTPMDMRVVVRDLLSGATATVVVLGEPEPVAAA